MTGSDNNNPALRGSVTLKTFVSMFGPFREEWGRIDERFQRKLNPIDG
jgi:hypothetical protein